MPVPAVSVARVVASSAVALALVCALAELLAGPGHRLGWWPLGAGLQTIRWAATGALAAAALGVIAVLLARVAGAAPALRAGLLAIVVGAAVAAPPILLWRQAQQLPQLHDISTDTENPPAYVAVVPLRQGARNPVEYPTETAAEQRRGYPDIGPALFDEPPQQAFARAEAAARAMGWELVAVAPQDLRIEATDTSLLFGFKDDVVIRVSARPGGSRVDMRSMSRVGVSDLGVNAKRIRAYMARLASTPAR